MREKRAAKYYRDWYKALSPKKRKKRLKQKRDYYHRTKDNPEEIERRKKYYQENKEQHCENGKLWREKNNQPCPENAKACKNTQRCL